MSKNFKRMSKEYQAIEQEVQELELIERPQVLTQDVSIAHDIQAQETQECHALAKKSSTRVAFILLLKEEKYSDS